MNFFDSEELNEITSGSFLCSQCGLCEAACPQGLSPRAVFVVGGILGKVEALSTRHDTRNCLDAPGSRG